jgi:hypothetical protein
MKKHPRSDAQLTQDKRKLLGIAWLHAEPDEAHALSHSDYGQLSGHRNTHRYLRPEHTAAPHDHDFQCTTQIY